MKKSFLPFAFTLSFCLSCPYGATYAASSGAGRSTFAKITTYLTAGALFLTKGHAYADSQMQTLGSRRSDGGTDIIAAHGGYIGIGHSKSDDIGLLSKGVLVNYDALCAPAWYMVFGNDGNTYPQAVQALGEHLYAMAGETDGWTLHNRMFVTVYDANTHTWPSTHRVGGTATSGAKTLAVREDGSYVSGGYVWNGDNFDILLAGFYANHTEAWERHIDSGGNDYLKMMLVLPNGYHLMADTDGVRGYAKDILSVEIDTEGVITSEKVLVSIGHGEVNAFLRNEEGIIFATGYVKDLTTGMADVLWAKLRQATGLDIAYAIGGRDIQVAYDAAWGPHGHAFLTGSIESDDGKDMFVYKMANETLVEGFSFGGDDEDKGCGIAVNEHAGAASFGSTFSNGMGAEDMFFVHWMTNDTAHCGTPLIPKPKTTDITHAFSWQDITLNNTLVNNTAESVTWQMYSLNLADEQICLSQPNGPFPTASPTQTTDPVLIQHMRPDIIDTIPAKNAKVGAPFVFQVVPKKFFESTQSPLERLTATEHDKETLPSWLSFEDNIFSGRPSEDDIGGYDIELTATTEDGAVRSLRFNINVYDPLEDPGIQIADWFKSLSAILGALLAVGVALACTYYCCKKHQEEQNEPLMEYKQNKEKDLSLEMQQLTQ